MMRGRVTHISLDGLSTDLGRSQVLGVTERLQSMGWQCTILSLEPKLVQEGHQQRLQARLDSAGIRWHHRPYRAGRRGALRNSSSMATMVGQVWGQTDLFHCRSYFGAFFPAATHVLGRKPYVFDTRAYWVDEKVEAGRWLQGSDFPCLGAPGRARALRPSKRGGEPDRACRP